MYILSAFLFSMFYVFVIVACNDASLRNMTTNLRGSDDLISEDKIEKYTNAITFEDPSPVLRDNNVNNPDVIAVVAIVSNSNGDNFPENFNLQEYLVERSWKNVIRKHLNMAIFVENEVLNQ